MKERNDYCSREAEERRSSCNERDPHNQERFEGRKMELQKC